MLLIFFGNIGTGKSTLAKALAERLNYELVYFDKCVWHSLKKEKIYSDKDEFLLTPEEIQKVYDEMHTIARSLLKKEKNVILESVYFQKQRKEAIQIAEESDVDFRLVEVVCDEKTVEKRLKKRKKENPQTAGFRLYKEYKERFEEEVKPHIVIDTTDKTAEESAQELIERLVLD